MTLNERKLARSLIIGLRGQQSISKEEFLTSFPSAVAGGKLSADLLERAFLDQNAEDLQCTLLIGFSFGFPAECVPTLSKLIQTEWHTNHEDIVEALKATDSQDIGTIEALKNATQIIPAYLEYDESRALAVKAIWTLGNINNSASRNILHTIASSNEPILSRAAANQLQRHGES